MFSVHRQFFIFFFILYFSFIYSSIPDIISTLHTDILENQQKSNQSLEFLQWGKTQGLWSSYIHINFVGDEIRTILRNDGAILDENMFVTAWITELLLEAHEENIISFPQDNLYLALNALLGFHDHNYNIPSPIYSFWSQEKYNGTWRANPSNVGEIFELLDNGRPAQAFYIPADSDDAAINLSIGSSLFRLESEFPDIFNLWKNINIGQGSMDILTNSLKEYSYKPFLNDTNVNTIDPRTYYWIQKYLNLIDSNDINISFITTWLLDIQKDKQSYYHDYAMPFNVNNVDGSVAANTIQGLTRSILFDPSNNTNSWFDSELQDLYKHTVNLISWIIDERLLDDRPDLVLLYYMGNYNFYWFVSRTIYLLSSYSEPLPYEVLENSLLKLKKSMQNNGTQAIIDAVQYENHLTKEFAFWDNFLGVNDTRNGNPINHANDRISTTAVAVNALIDTWTYKSSQCNYTWYSNTPDNIKTIIDKAINWLEYYSTKDRYRLENAFFSGSVKGDDLPFWFPQNYVMYLNGTKLDNINELRSINNINDEVITGFSGVVSTNEYQDLLEQHWFGMKTPTTWEGYNVSSNSTLIYWSSPDLTRTCSLIALGRYLQLC